MCFSVCLLVAAVLQPYLDHVHSGIFLVTGGFGVGARHPHILQVRRILSEMISKKWSEVWIIAPSMTLWSWIKHSPDLVSPRLLSAVIYLCVTHPPFLWCFFLVHDWSIVSWYHILVYVSSNFRTLQKWTLLPFCLFSELVIAFKLNSKGQISRWQTTTMTWFSQ